MVHFRHGTLRCVKHLFDRLPPRRLAGLAVLGPRHQRLLHPVRHSPPLAHLRVLPHALHVPGIVVPDVLEAGKQDAGFGVVEDAVCYGVSAEGPHHYQWTGLTILDVAILDLLQHLGPYRGVHLLVLGHVLGLELDDLCEAAARVAASRLGPAGRDGRRGACWRTPELRHGDATVASRLEAVVCLEVLLVSRWVDNLDFNLSEWLCSTILRAGSGVRRHLRSIEVARAILPQRGGALGAGKPSRHEFIPPITSLEWELC